MSLLPNIQILKTDITQLAVDAIVNAANSSLLGGGGVDGAIHSAAGPQLLAECRRLNGCQTGLAKITKGYLLKASYVIHTVGPVWQGGGSQEDELLASCYRQSLLLASKQDLKSIAFPNISTGVYGFPKQLAAQIALNEVFDFMRKNKGIEKVIFAIFDDENLEIYKHLSKEF
jgi:O-acetyl-ADP-ribose deacetylase (regulator of RNase III)